MPVLCKVLSYQIVSSLWFEHGAATLAVPPPLCENDAFNGLI
jgi:hypothetical protein